MDYLGFPPCAIFDEGTTFNEIGVKCFALGEAACMDINYDLLYESENGGKVKEAVEKFKTFCKNIWQIITGALNKLLTAIKERIKGVPTEEVIMRAYNASKERGVVVTIPNILIKKNIDSLTSEIGNSIKNNAIVKNLFSTYNFLLHNQLRDIDPDSFVATMISKKFEETLNSETNIYPKGTKLTDDMVKIAIDSTKNQTKYENNAKKLYNDVKNALNDIIKVVEQLPGNEDYAYIKIKDKEPSDYTKNCDQIIRYTEKYISLIGSMEASFMKFIDTHFATSLWIIKRFERKEDEFAKDPEKEKQKVKDEDERFKRQWGF